MEHPCLGDRHPEIFRTARMLVEAPYVILDETRPDAIGRGCEIDREGLGLYCHLLPKFDDSVWR